MPSDLVDAAELVPEAAFTLHVMEYAVQRGWAVMHISDSRRSYSKGFPDLLLAKPGRIVFAELKKVKVARSTNRGLSKVQMKWHEVLAPGPSEWYLWTPAMWDEVEEVLNR